MIRHLAAVSCLATTAPAAAATIALQWQPEKMKTVAGPDEAVVVVVMSHYGHAGSTGTAWQRYDRQTRTLVAADKHGPLSGFTLDYIDGPISSKKAPDQGYVGVVPAGDYVLVSDGSLRPHSFCLGAPVIHLAPGAVVYAGGFRTYMHAPIEGLPERQALGWEGDIARARAALASQPELAAALVAAPIENGVTFPCGPGAIAYRVPGAPDLAP